MSCFPRTCLLGELDIFVSAIFQVNFGCLPLLRVGFGGVELFAKGTTTLRSDRKSLRPGSSSHTPGDCSGAFATGLSFAFFRSCILDTRMVFGFLIGFCGDERGVGEFGKSNISLLTDFWAFVGLDCQRLAAMTMAQ
jgi:hypothetical protein